MVPKQIFALLSASWTFACAAAQPTRLPLGASKGPSFSRCDDVLNIVVVKLTCEEVALAGLCHRLYHATQCPSSCGGCAKNLTDHLSEVPITSSSSPSVAPTDIPEVAVAATEEAHSKMGMAETTAAPAHRQGFFGLHPRSPQYQLPHSHGRRLQASSCPSGFAQLHNIDMQD